MYEFQQITTTSTYFTQVLKLRELAYCRDSAGLPDEIDGHSLHFIAKSGEHVVAALRVTCRKHGPLESENHYPQWVFQEFGDQICAASRMCVMPNLQAITTLPLDITRFAWSIALKHGIRIDVTKARLKAIPFYLKMGYHFIKDSIFEFERWNARCALIAYPVNAKYRTKLADIFVDVHNPCELDRSPHAKSFISSYKEFSNVTNQSVTRE